MTTVSFDKWLDDLNAVMSKQHRILFLILHICFSHNVANRSNADLLFLPPNVRSVAQPLDAGIIKAFKDRFRRQMFEDLRGKIEGISEANDYVKQLTVYEAAAWSVKALEEMSPTVFVNCFATCRISKQVGNKLEEPPNEDLQRSINELDFPPDSLDLLKMSSDCRV